MKKKLFEIIFIICILLVPMFALAQQTGPGDPGGEPTGGDPPLGGGAPIGNGIYILLGLSAVYGGRKIYKSSDEKELLKE